MNHTVCFVQGSVDSIKYHQVLEKYHSFCKNAEDEMRITPTAE